MNDKSSKMLWCMLALAALFLFGLQLVTLLGAWRLHDQGFRGEAEVVSFLGTHYAPKAGTSFSYMLKVKSHSIAIQRRTPLILGKKYSVIYLEANPHNLVVAAPTASVMEVYRLRFSDDWLGWVSLFLLPVVTLCGAASAWKVFIHWKEKGRVPTTLFKN